MPEFSDACKMVCEKFKIKSFNRHQNQAFIALVGEKKDFFVNLPTGFEKSFIYQALPLIFDENYGSEWSCCCHFTVVKSDTRSDK